MIPHDRDTERWSGRHRMQLFRALFILCTSGLSALAQQPAKNNTPIEIRELVDGGTKETNRLVTVQGCLVKEFEIRILQPCGVRFDQFSKYSVWLDDILQVTSENKQEEQSSFIPAQSHDTLKNGRGRLWELIGNRDHPHMIIVEGEFQVGARRKFGHLNFYKSRFIVHRFVEASDTGK